MTICSSHAGAGKSFRVRHGVTYEKYVHAPASTTKQFLRGMKIISEKYRKTAVSGEDGRLLMIHVDIFDTAEPELNSLLFEILIFGGFVDFFSGKSYLFHPSTMFRLEVASGPLIKRMAVPALFPIEEVTPDRLSFESSRKGLLRGMGPHRFFESRYDGTSLRKREQGVCSANAFEMLQYVCAALQILDETGGQFPYVFEGSVLEPSEAVDSLRSSLSDSLSLSISLSLSTSLTDSIDETIVEGSECFDLLIKYSELPSERTSLWCLWNFVNMVYWQLRDMHYPDSPLNNACMSDKSGEKKERGEAKERIKGEIVKFILKTAREFAVRQTNEIPDDSFVGVNVDGFSRGGYNGFWLKRFFFFKKKI